MPHPISLSLAEATEELRTLAQEFTLIENPGTPFPRRDIVPLAPRHAAPQGPLRAMLMDMDGTTTLTEDLCVAALESGLRDATRKSDGTPVLDGLNPEKDYPHIIGTSASTNIAYLLDAYAKDLQAPAMRCAFVRASAWNLNAHRDPIRRAEAETTVRICGGATWLDSPDFLNLVARTDASPLSPSPELGAALARLAEPLVMESHEQLGRALLDIYYEYLHGYFTAIGRGEGASVAQAVYNDPTRPAIAPLHGITLACAMAKGLLADFPEAAVALAEQAADRKATPKQSYALHRAVASFAKQPPLVALVTSSGYYEARTVLSEVFRGMRIEVTEWPLPDKTIATLVDTFKTPENYYDAIITADESHEIRLKPYRDLYTIAARNLGLDQAALRDTIGFEDTWAGVTAMRSAGVGVPCAVPFHGSRSHDFSLASHVFQGGLPEVILDHALFYGPES